MAYSVETKGLSHYFSKDKPILKDIKLQVPVGSIFGFLGKNGAGKTTTLKLILGLLKVQEGEVFVFGKQFQKSRITSLRDIGSLIESPSFYAHLSARDNLIILQKIYQCPISRIEEVLEIVDLTGAKNKKVSQFSLGMKQRLSIAIALLHEPKLLILDEPTNGLDPSGIIEIRSLLKMINQKFKTTIIVSSHLLTEIEKIASHLAIINDGKLIFQGTFMDLKEKQKKHATTKFETSDPNQTAAILATFGFFPQIHKSMVGIPRIDSDKLTQVIKSLISHEVDISQIINTEMNLESMFINLTEN